MQELLIGEKVHYLQYFPSNKRTTNKTVMIQCSGSKFFVNFILQHFFSATPFLLAVLTVFVSQQFSLADLFLSERARRKMILLAGRRYDPKTDTITLVGKRCPTRKQNRDYVMHLLAVLYMESKVRVVEGVSDTFLCLFNL